MPSASPEINPRPAGAVFLSYAREDSDAAKRIADALRAFGVEVWFDQSELRGGDAWDQKIRGQIKTCALFVPLVSTNTQARGEGYFRREWKLAVERTLDMAAGIAFIVPVVIDDTREADAAVPEEFMRYQWTRLAHGVPSPQFVEQLKRLLESPRKALPVVRGEPVVQVQTVRPGERARPLAWIIVVLAIAVGAGAFLWRKSNSSPNAAAPALSSAAVTPKPATPAVSDLSVAVLAFSDLSEKRDSEYFSDGISEELLNVLAKVPGLRVAARTSAFSFKGKNLPIADIAAKLNVAYVVEGSVQRAGDNVRITAQLIKAADGFHVWSEHFDRELKNVFAVQDEIAGLVAKNLSLKLGASSAATAPAASVNPQALEFYLQARQAFNLRTTDGFARADDLLNRAIALEPAFARAYALQGAMWGVRDSTTSLISAFGQRNSPTVTRIRAQIDRALALEPNLAEAHAALGNLFWLCWRVDDAARELRLAIALNPSDAFAHQVLGRVLLSDGRLDEAEQALKHAVELDPLSHRIIDNYSIIPRLTGRASEALALDERALALQPDALQASVWKARDLSALGRHDEAVAWLRRLPLEHTIYATFVAEVFAEAGLKAEAEKMTRDGVPGYRYVGLVGAGRLEEALASMDPDTIQVQGFAETLFRPGYDAIRHDPRFVKLLATLGMTEAHARAQAWRAAHPELKK